MQTMHIGSLEVSAMGYGAMVLEGYYGDASEQEAMAVIKEAVKEGITLIDTADAYGDGHNELLVAKALAGAPKEVVVATKVGVVTDEHQDGHVFTTGWGHQLKINTSPAYVRWAVEQSLRRLNQSVIDLLYLHYIDPVTPIEDTMRVLAAFAKQGIIKEIGLSNMTADQLRRAHAVHPIAAVQYEYSLQNRSAEAEILPLTKELGITFVAWSPLGSGLLTIDVDRLSADDFRQLRFDQAKGLDGARQSLKQLHAMANGLGVTPAQLALAWLYHKSNNIVTIPGTRKASRIRENLASLDITLTSDRIIKLDQLSSGNAFGYKHLLR